MIQSKKQKVLLICSAFFSFFLFLHLPLISAPISDKEYNSLVHFFKATSGEEWNSKWDITKNNVLDEGCHGTKVKEGKIVETDVQDNNLADTIHNDNGKHTGISVKYPGNFSLVYQVIDYPLFIYSGNDVEIVLPDICIHDPVLNQFKVTFTIGDNIKEGMFTATEDGKIVIPKNFIESANLNLNMNSSVIILQTSGLATGTQLRYNHIGISNAKIPDSEYEFLKELFNTTAGLGWKTRWDISTNNVHEGGWSGVTVEYGHVVELNLPSNQLRGTLPKSIKNLELLRVLNLDNNVALAGALPKEIENLKELTTLTLYNCRFEGDIPLDFSKMPQLKKIDFRYNEFSTIKAGINRNVNLYIQYQNIQYDQFRYRGDTVDVKLPNIMLYNYSADNYSARNTMYFYINNNHVATMKANDEGYVRIPKTVLTSLNAKDAVRICQYEGNAEYTNINFKTVDILTKKIPDSEYEALVAIYNALDGPNWKNGYIWDISSNNLHTSVWPGVTLEDGHVVGLNLNYAYKKGILPKEIGNLTMLRNLNLNAYYDNKIKGNLPEEIGKLINLEYFYATWNNLSGNIPASFGNLTKLKELNLSYNSLGVGIPQEFANLENLISLYLDHNLLSEDIPNELKNLNNLVVLNLSNNKFSGKLPAFFPELPSLTTLDLSCNSFSGAIPKEYGSKIKLSTLNLYKNKLDSIEAGIARGLHLNITEQSLNRNLFKFTGDTVEVQLPAIMRYNYEKNDYSAHNNFSFRLSGYKIGQALQCDENGLLRIPKEYMQTINKNHKVSIYQNHINYNITSYYSTLSFDSLVISTKKIPDSEYEALVAIYNALDGPNWKNGYTWDISSNNLHTSVWPGVNLEDGHVVGLNLHNAYKKGILPKEIGNLTMLRTLNLNAYYDNKIKGNLPEEIGKLVNLEYFYATWNNLSGNIPASFGNLTKLKRLNLSHNSMDGSIPRDFSKLESLTSLYLNHNLLSEDIPNELKNLNNLDTLNLSNNKFSGKLPAFFPELPSLTTLDLSCNSFSGAIPKEYGSKIKLSTLNLYQNKLDSIEAGIARGLYLKLTEQSLNRKLFKFSGDTVEVHLPAIMRYNYEKNDYSAHDNFIFRLSGYKIGQALQCDENGLLKIPKEYMQTINKNHKVSIYQNHINYNITSYDSTLSFDSLVISTKKIPDSEYEALVAIYNALDGPNWKNGYIWDISSNNLHTSVWPGVTLEDGHVVGLNLHNAYKKGILPKEIGNLTMLRTLNLNAYYDNKIKGNLPEEIGKLVNLEYFYATWNNLSGNIPTSLNNLTKLKEISLQYNNISGSLPDLFSSSPVLQSVNFYSNRIDSIGNGLKSGMAIDMRNQYCRGKVFTYLGDTVDIQLPPMMRYDYVTNGFTTKNNFDVKYGNTTLITNLQANEKGILRIPKEVLGTLRTQNSTLVSIYQTNGTSNTSSLTFDSVKVNLAPIPQKEYEALIAIYNKLGGENWRRKWDITKGNNVNEGWDGVAVENGHVVEINLSDNKLSGEIPSEIGDFSKLRVLDLSNNSYDDYKKLKGIIPSEIGRLTELEYLRIYNQALTGKINFWIDKLEKLKVLVLEKNYLTGSIPESMEKLTRLNHINVANNQFKGGIPDRIGNLQYLEYLNLSNNELSGTIPNSLNDLPSIKELYINNNMFEGMESKLPYQPHIAVNVQNQKITKDKILISGDYILYDLPIMCRYDHTRGDLFAANTFYIYVDEFKNSAPIKANEEGRLSIPRGYFSALKPNSKIKFKQSNGSAQGTTIEFNEYYVGKPVDDKEYKALVDLYKNTGGKDWTYTWDISVNNLHERMWYGVVIEDGHVVKLELQNNQLKGELPASLSQLTYLKELSLYNNNLTGTIPASIGKLDSLSHVYLYKNKLTGDIPSKLFDLKNISVLLLNNNQLSGEISDKITTLPNLRIFNISDNNFSGTIPDVLFKLPAIKELYVSKNKYDSMNQAFNYDNTISVYIETQKIAMPDYVLAEGTNVKAKSVVLNTYDKISHTFDAQNTFELYIENKMIAQSNVIENGFIIFNIVLKDYKDIENVYVIQRNGSAYGTTMYYQGIKDGSQIQIEDAEYFAIVKLNKELGGENWINKWDISKNDIHLGEWFGIHFSNGHITGIELESNNLSGYLPDVFKDLPYLSIFDIAVNKVKGNIPASLMRLESLKKVVLSDNALGTMDEVTFAKNVNLNMARQIVEYPNYAFSQNSTFTASNIHRYNHLTSSFADNVGYRLIMGTVSRNINVNTPYSLGKIMKRWSIPQGQLLELQLQDNSAGNNSRNKYYLTFKEGDVDMNELVNILDIQLLIQDMQNQIPASVFFNESAADINKDGNRNILDIVAIVNSIQNKELEVDESITRMCKNELPDQSILSIKDGVLYLNTVKPINAFDIRLKHANINKTEKLYKNKEMNISIVQNADETSILGFSTSGASLRGKVAIANVGNATIENAILADREAQPVDWKMSDCGIENEEKSVTGIQNYPNPFSNRTVVRFYLPEGVKSGELIIYSLTDKMVYKEKLTDLNAGNHEITIQLGDFVSGVYPYILKLKTSTGTKLYKNKMMIK